MARHLRHSLLLALMLGVVSVSAPQLHAQNASQDSLYKRLGGYDAIAAVTDDFLGRLVTDPKESRFFTGLSTDSKARVRQHVVDFLCNATGGPCKYTGRDMRSAHARLGISDAQFTALVEDLVMTLDKLKVPSREKGELLAVLGPMKGDIVTRN